MPANRTIEVTIPARRGAPARTIVTSARDTRRAIAVARIHVAAHGTARRRAAQAIRP